MKLTQHIRVFRQLSFEPGRYQSGFSKVGVYVHVYDKLKKPLFSSLKTKLIYDDDNQNTFSD